MWIQDVLWTLASSLVRRKLNHPNIVAFFGTESIGETMYIFLEYMPGGSLSLA